MGDLMVIYQFNGWFNGDLPINGWFNGDLND